MAEPSLPDERVFAGVELGGTKAIAVVWRAGRIVDRVVVPTADPPQTIASLGDWLAAHPLRPVTQRVVTCPSAAGWTPQIRRPPVITVARAAFVTTYTPASPDIPLRLGPSEGGLL